MTKEKMKRILIVGGGTGGHVFPGLAVAHALRERGIDVHWLGTRQGLESRLVPEANFPLHFVTIKGIRGKGWKPLLMAPYKISYAISESYKIIKKINPDAILGMGGFVSGPAGMASWFKGLPLIIHEQNAKAGFTNKFLSYFASKVLEAFPDSFSKRVKALTVGNPIRVEILNLPPPSARVNDNRSQLRLLVLGGSLGAQTLNEIVPKALATLPILDRPEVFHQTGDKHFESTKKLYEYVNIHPALTSFIQDMAKAYRWADLVICRAGAITVSELCAAGLGAIFVPYPFAVDDHQTANANFMVENNAALCIQQKELTTDRLAMLLNQFIQSPKKCLTMANAAYGLRKAQVTEKVFDILQEVVNDKEN